MYSVFILIYNAKGMYNLFIQIYNAIPEYKTGQLWILLYWIMSLAAELLSKRIEYILYIVCALFVLKFFAK